MIYKGESKLSLIYIWYKSYQMIKSINWYETYQVRKKMKKKKAIKVFLIADVICLIVAGIMVFTLHSDLLKDDNTDKIEIQTFNLNNDENVEAFEEAATDTMAWDYLDPSKSKTLSEWQEINPKICMVLKICGREFPVIENDESYLAKNAYGKYDYVGTPYCLNGEKYKTVLAHSVYSRSDSYHDLMFTFLADYTDKEFFFDNELISITDQSGDHDYLAIALMHLDENAGEWNGWYSDRTSIDELLSWVIDKSVLRVNIDYGEDPNVLTLVTCDITQDNARHMIVFIEV